ASARFAPGPRETPDPWRARLRLPHDRAVVVDRFGRRSLPYARVRIAAHSSAGPGMAVIDQERLRIAVIGCGLVGTRRAAETSLHSRTRLLLCIDTAHAPARNTAERYDAAWSTD